MNDLTIMATKRFIGKQINGNNPNTQPHPRVFRSSKKEVRTGLACVLLSTWLHSPMGVIKIDSIPARHKSVSQNLCPTQFLLAKVKTSFCPDKWWMAKYINVSAWLYSSTMCSCLFGDSLRFYGWWVVEGVVYHPSFTPAKPKNCVCQQLSFRLGWWRAF